MQDEMSTGSSSDTAGSSRSSMSSSCSVSSTSSIVSPMAAAAAAEAKAHAAASSAASAASSSAATAKPSPPKKTRSQSPGAVQRRRIQNRIAQRNHRQKIKERAAEERDRLAREQANEHVVQQAHLFSSRSSTGSVSSHSSLTNYPGQFSSNVSQHHSHTHSSRTSPSPIQIPGARLQPPGTMDNLGSGLSDKGWIPDPTLLPTPDGDLATYATEYLSMSCSCNSLTGPCSHHREEMRVQFLSFMSSAQNEQQTSLMATTDSQHNHHPHHTHQHQHQHQHQHHNHHQKKNAFSSPMDEVLLDKLMQPSMPSPPLFSDLHTPSEPSCPPPPSFQPHQHPPPSSSPGSASPREAIPDPYSNTTSSSTSSTNNTSSSSTNSSATNTSRFKAILTFVRAAGFADFDSMVTSYYTSSFQKNSVADLAQRSSRGRRLGGVLESLRESAAGWTVWESRQYREGVVAAAQGLYVQELEVVLKRARRRQQQQQAQAQASQQSQQTQQAQQQQSQQQQAQQQQDVLMFGSDECSEASSSSVASIGSMLSGGVAAAPEEMGRVFQDNLPNLWALLTELAGAQGLQCDRVALAALLLLYNARQNPDVDVDDLVPDWHSHQEAEFS